MSEYDDDFFADKRPWSVIKDQVLGSYITPYMAKVNKLGKKILLIDGFAGPGVFEDGKAGSPMILCAAAEKFANNNYQAIFVNKKLEFHTKLRNVLEKAGYNKSTLTVLGDTLEILPTLPALLSDQTVFLYLDPFGPTGSPFSLIEPFLRRNTNYSTEIVIMMHMPAMHRFASWKAVNEGRENEDQIQKNLQKMNETFGDENWKSIMWRSDISAEEKEFALIKSYQNKLSTYLPYTGSCPVREGYNTRIKYFIVFASRHPHAMVLMHDAMMRAYFQQMHTNEYQGSFFENDDWRDTFSKNGLSELILTIVKAQPGITRENLWVAIVRNNFMKYLRKDFTDILQSMIEKGIIYSPTPRRSIKRLNDECILFIK